MADPGAKTLKSAERTVDLPDADRMWADLSLPETSKTLAADVSIRARRGSSERKTTHPDRLDSIADLLEALPALDITDEQAAEREWQLHEELGRGGMGVVSRATQRSLRRDVAVKHLPDKMRRTSNKSALIDEARVLGTLQHPNIVPVYALGTDERGDPVMVMKRIEGVLWSELLADPKHAQWPSADHLSDNLEVLMQVCRAIEYAHSRNLVHRDLKPENVMLGDFGEVYVLDWGVACSLDTQEDGPLTAQVKSGGKSASLVGTPCYMAPEMLRRASVTERTDVFLLGGLLHEALTGAPPHEGDSLYEVLFAVASAEPREYDTDLPRELVEICERALSPQPAARYPSAAAFREAVTAAERHRASIRLTRDALTRLEPASSGEASDEARSWQRLWECRFGLRQALDMWADNADAERGLERCLARMVEHAVAGRDEVMASAMLAELGDNPELAKQVEALRDELARERDQVGKLRHVAEQHDVEKRQALRGKQLLWMCGANAALGACTIVLLHGFGVEPTYPVALVIGAMPPPIVAFFLFFRHDEHSPVSARLLTAFLTMTCVALFLRVLGWHLDVALHATIAFELAMDNLAAWVTAILVDRRLMRPAVFSTACSALTLVFPHLSITLLLVGVTLGLTWAGFIWARDAT